MTPYLKGLYQTINSWRSYTRDGGWRMSMIERDLVRKAGDHQSIYYEKTEPPQTVVPVSILKGDATASKELTKSIDPPLREARCIKLGSVFLGGCDASG